MALQDVTSPPSPPAHVDAEQVEAALVEHYPRLVRLAYLVLPSSPGRHRRVLAAHAVVQRSLPSGRRSAAEPQLPAQAPGEGGVRDVGYALLRHRVLRAALEAARPRRLAGRETAFARRLAVPLLPQVLGLRLLPKTGGADALALDQELSAAGAPARAAYALRALERLGDDDVRRLLAAAGVADPQAALEEADGVGGPAGSRNRSPLASPEFDPCVLQVRPPDLVRRRQHARAAAVAGAALVLCGLLLGMPGDTWGPDGAAAPPYARNAAAERALEPRHLTRVEPGAWRDSARADFSVWPARGALIDDAGLLRRALAAWARPGPQVRVSATPGTPTGPAAGPPQLLYAGEVNAASVVVLYDGLRVVRYAEPTGARRGTVALDFARVDGADRASSSALLVARSDENVRYLLAPWVTGASEVDLVAPSDEGYPMERASDGVTSPVVGPVLGSSNCSTWPALRLSVQGGGSYVLTDLGELTPALLTYGEPEASGSRGGVFSEEAREVLARGACRLSQLAGRGVRTVNTWQFALQNLPEYEGLARWVCTRADTWRGTGPRVLAQFQIAAGDPGTQGAVVARADGSPACGEREPRVLSGVLWKSDAGNWYLLAAGSEEVVSITAEGEVDWSAPGRTLAVATEQGAEAELSAELDDGTRLPALR